MRIVFFKADRFFTRDDVRAMAAPGSSCFMLFADNDRDIFLRPDCAHLGGKGGQAAAARPSRDEPLQTLGIPTLHHDTISDCFPSFFTRCLGPQDRNLKAYYAEDATFSVAALRTFSVAALRETPYEPGNLENTSRYRDAAFAIIQAKITQYRDTHPGAEPTIFIPCTDTTEGHETFAFGGGIAPRLIDAEQAHLRGLVGELRPIQTLRVESVDEAVALARETPRPGTAASGPRTSLLR